MDIEPLRIVLDTNVLISLIVFRDERLTPLARAWESGRLTVLSDTALRQEFARVLDYPAFCTRCAPEQALALYDRRVLPGEAISGGLALCRDPDDQKFLLLAAGAGATALITDDKAILRMRRKMDFEIETPLVFQRRLGEAGS